MNKPIKKVVTQLHCYSLPLEACRQPGKYKSDTIRFIASKLYESGKLSIGQAADMAGLTKRTFAELLPNFTVF